MINGIINVYKEKGYTSFDVVALMRGIAGQRKVGHTGTLDPMAEGVLPVCLGSATKLCDMLNDKSKEYVAVFVLGKRTDTLDATGTVLEERKVCVTPEQLKEAVMSFKGGYNQLPPMFSAKWVNGQRLYDLARKGREVERTPVFVEINDIEVIDVSLPYFTIRVSCGKGTYIRSLGEDIAAKCGEIAMMTELTRTRVSNFEIGKAYTLSELSKMRDEGSLASVVLSTDEAMPFYRKVFVKSEFDRLLDNGNKLRTSEVTKDFYAENGEILRMYKSTGMFTGLYVFRENEGNFVPYKMFIGE